MELEFHELANIFPLLPQTELSQLSEDIRQHGLQEPIIIFEGKILDGRNRYLACQRAAVEPMLIEWRQNGISALDYVIARNLHRRHLDESQRAMVAKKLATLRPGRPSEENRQICRITQAEAASLLNVSERSIRHAGEVLDKGTPELVAAVEQGKIAVSAAAEFADLPKEVQQEEIVLPIVSGEKTVAEIKKAIAHVAHNSGNNEWYTPPEYIEAARKVMGRIDTDPASCELANKTVRAKHFFGIEQDGLAQEWTGNVWMNPPYGQPYISDFAQKFVDKFQNGEFDQACVLVNNATETGWFKSLAESCSAVAFIKGRIKYFTPDGTQSGSPLQGQAILYFGKNPQKFANVFCEFGYVFVGKPISYIGS